MYIDQTELEEKAIEIQDFKNKLRDNERKMVGTHHKLNDARTAYETEVRAKEEMLKTHSKLISQHKMTKAKLAMKEKEVVALEKKVADKEYEVDLLKHFFLTYFSRLNS